ncbi:hypothetical protein HIM_01810 [Hirsutella minnesotensis 3608]|nr:hypothetical protein HIM_01810 [Hirsutella minnesotensis 3608]
MHEAPIPVQERLRRRKFIGEEAVAAIHGKRLPLNLGRPLQRLCTVRGIRHHEDFAKGEAACLKGHLPMFTQAINARLIMSGEVPQMHTPEDMPYCIWYPDVPPEDSLRKLAEQCPGMRYQIGRACAVGGYTNLFTSLDILPEVAIAEEARESGNLEIYELIVNELVKWKVFDDYTGTVSKPIPAYLNGDTVVCKELASYRQGFIKPSGRTDAEDDGDDDSDDLEPGDSDSWLWDDPWGYEKLQNKVTGDEGLDAPDTWAEMPVFHTRFCVPSKEKPDDEDTIKLLCNPLPRDLPSCNKDVLIVMAAYRGDIDRYCRLRRPYFVGNELGAVVRGIYHNTQFAKWWATQPRPGHVAHTRQIATAIVARFIMNDDISLALTINKGGFNHWSPGFPKLIYYPAVAQPTTYKALAHALPEMRSAVARAAIYADFQELFDWLMKGPNGEFENVVPTRSLWIEALQSPHDYYRVTLEAIARERGIFDQIGNFMPDLPYWEQVSVRETKFHMTSNDLKPMDRIWENIESWQGYWSSCFYNSVSFNASKLERLLSLPKEWQPTEEDLDPDLHHRILDYDTWPPNIEELLKSARG